MCATLQKGGAVPRARGRVTCSGHVLVAVSRARGRGRTFQKGGSAGDIFWMGTAKPTEAAKKMRIIQRTIRLNCSSQIACERGTLTQLMPATNAPRRCDPIKGVPPISWTDETQPKKKRVASIRKRWISSRGWIETSFLDGTRSRRSWSLGKTRMARKTPDHVMRAERTTRAVRSRGTCMRACMHAARRDEQTDRSRGRQTSRSSAR